MATRYWIGGDSGNENDYGTAANWSGSTLPTTNDTVIIAARTTQYAITDGMADLTGVSLTAFIVEEGFAKNIGTEDAPLDVTTGRFEYSGEGQAWFDFEASSTDVEVKQTGTAVSGQRAFNIVAGSGIGTVSVRDGEVGIANRAGESATVTTVRVVGNGAEVWVGSGCSLTTFQQTGGENILRCAATTVIVDGGSLVTEEIGAITTLTGNGGTIECTSTGTIGTLTVNGAIVNFTTSGEARTVTSHKLNSGQISFDPDVITFTNAGSAADYPVRHIVMRAV